MRKTNLLVNGLLASAAIFEAIVILRMRKTFGVLEIDRTGETDLYMFNILDDLNGLSKKKYIRLKVDNNATLSQH